MATFSKRTFAVVLSSSLLLHLFSILDYARVSEAAVIRPRRSLEFRSLESRLYCQSSSQYQYSVVIDAGSSGSRVHVYRWTQNTAGHVQSTPGAVQALRPTLKIRVGLASIASNLTIVRDHVERLLMNASRIVPPELYQYTPVYFMATAGMRQMMEPRINEVMTYIDSLMSNTDINPFRYNLMNGSRVLSGEEEAIFSWISVNYLLGNFAGKADKPLVGMVEMGGASVQIAFVSEGGYNSGHLFPVHMSNRRFLVYAHSYLGYGRSSVIDYIKTKLEEDNHSSNFIHHPCMLRGDVQTTASGKTFVGSGNPQACLDLLREHVVYKDASRCQPQQCAIGAVSQPPLPRHLQFYAIGAFVYTLPSIGALTNDAIFVPEIGYKKAFEFCKLSYDEALMVLSEAERKYVTDKCLAALYMPLLLDYGLGFSNDSSVIHVLGNIAGQKPGWTLGAVLYENSHLHHDCQRAAAAVEHDGDDNNDNYDIRVVLSRLLTVGNDKNIA